jgi:hypothetical protein
MGRDNEITVYVSDETKQEIKQRADDEDKTISTYVDGVLRRYFIMEDEEQVATETRAEQRLEELIALGKDELQETAQEIAKMNTKMGAYAAANFELMKRDYHEARRRDALSTGARRIRTPVADVLDDLDQELDTDTETEPAAGDAAPRDSSADSETESDRESETESVFDRIRGDQ